LWNRRGEECTILYAGKDGTDDFEEIGHSNTAKEMLESYYIGEYEVRFAVIDDRCSHVLAFWDTSAMRMVVCCCIHVNVTV